MSEEGRRRRRRNGTYIQLPEGQASSLKLVEYSKVGFIWFPRSLLLIVIVWTVDIDATLRAVTHFGTLVTFFG